MIQRPGKWLRLFRRQPLLAELHAFKQQQGVLALVSDYPARRKLQALGVSALFDVVVANGEAGGPRWLKPNPEGLLSAAERLGVNAERCLVLGDRADVDGEAARRAGMAFRRVR
jgi:HAD superfamily hydrolase (TIGR01549 family)